MICNKQQQSESIVLLSTDNKLTAISSEQRVASKEHQALRTEQQAARKGEQTASSERRLVNREKW